MSSLRNAVKRHTHKERSQPARRKKLGLLEKKKDYLERARDFHKKEARLARLHRKADARNPDEFYFGMIGKRTKGGVHTIEKEHASEDVVKLVRSQNINYLKVHESAEAGRISRLNESLHFLGADGGAEGAGAKHTVFLSDDEDADDFDKAAYFETTDGFADRRFNRPTKRKLAEGSLLASGDSAAVKTAMKAREKSYAQLEQRIERRAKIKQALAHMETYKNLGGKGQRYKVKDAERGRPAVYKWKQERKR